MTEWRKHLINLLLWTLVWWGLSPWIVYIFKLAPSDSSSPSHARTNEEIQIYSYKRYISCYLLTLLSIIKIVEHGSTCQSGAASVSHLHWSSFEKQIWNCASIIVCCLIPCVTAVDNDRIFIGSKNEFYFSLQFITWYLFGFVCVCACVCSIGCCLTVIHHCSPTYIISATSKQDVVSTFAF